MRQIQRRMAVARLFKIHQHGRAVITDQKVAGVCVKGNQAPRWPRGLCAAGGKGVANAVDQRTRGGGQPGLVEVTRLQLDLKPQRIERVVGIEQRRPQRRLGQGQRMDRRQGLRDGAEVFRQACRAAHHLFDQQPAARQRRAGRKQADDAWHMPAGRGPLEAGRLVVEVLLRGQAHLALLGQPRDQAGANQAHVVVRQALVRHQLKRCVCRVRRSVGHVRRSTGHAGACRPKRVAQPAEKGIRAGRVMGMLPGVVGASGTSGTSGIHGTAAG